MSTNDIGFYFDVYVGATGRSDVKEVIDAYDIKSKVAFMTAIRHLHVTPRSQWQVPQWKKVQSYAGLYEIRYKANNNQTRALGKFCETTENMFVITMICTHKGKVYDPPNAFETAEKRYKSISKGSCTTHPLKVNGECFPEI